MSMSSPEGKKEQAPSKKGTLIIGLSLAAAVIVLVATVFFLLKASNVVEPVALKVGDREVTKQQLENYTKSGKAINVSAADVRRTIIEHEKNVQIAKKHDIVVPEAFISRSNSGADAAEDNAEARDYLKLVRYNQAFEARLTQLPLAGYGVVVYEIPARALTADNKQNLSQAKEVAKQFRSQITDLDQSSAVVLDRVMQYNADEGQTANSGVRFVPSEVIFDDSATGSLMSDAYLLKQVKDKKTGVTEVQESGTNSVFFLDILFEQKKRTDILSQVQQDKESMKVVEYDV